MKKYISTICNLRKNNKIKKPRILKIDCDTINQLLGVISIT